ncbi:MAG TPA: cupin domain-containing protein [Burkholderiales bacterium]|nr:cupin domain-containing protein [Burkholderiales bacterium]
MDSRLLGGLAPRTFLRRHWQKRPLLVRGALPAFQGVVNERRLVALAARDDVESRIVERRGRRWNTVHGPFDSLAISKRNFTLLVSGVNMHVDAADRLLRRFDFVPQARLDDVMVSYATPGGGVGPHVDSYDVFLLQGPGRRRWTIWLSPGKKIEYVVEPGDLLYLPPGLKHDGVAIDPCFTYSIGFRAPRGAELAAAFLDWLHERGLPDASYADPGLRPARHPAKIPKDLLRFSSRLLGRIDWTGADAADFLGRFLTEPKPHVVFRPARSAGPVVALDPKTQLLYDGRRFFVNGESFTVPASCAPVLRELADRRSMERRRLAAAPLAGLISAWLHSGYARLQRIQP